MLYELINFDKLRRAVFLALLLLAGIMLQTLVLPRLPVLGARPMIIPCAVAAVGVFYGGLWGGVFGLASGIACDLSYVETLVMFTITLPIIGYLAGEMTKRVINQGIFSYMIFCAAALLVCAFLQSFDIMFFSKTNKLSVIIVAFLQIFWSLPYAFALYFPCRTYSKKL